MSAQCHLPLFRLRAWVKRWLIVISSVFIAVVFAFVIAGPLVFTITTSLANSSITGRSIRVMKCRCDFHASDVIHLPHLVQESIYSVGHPPLHARYHQALGIDPEQLVDRFIQQMPTALKRGQIKKAQPVRTGSLDDPQKRNNQQRGNKRTSFRTAACKRNRN